MNLLERLPYEWRLGWRYTRAGRASRRNGFISFISAVSMLGIALGVAALIIVLSVMNGFQKDVLGRMLSVIPHIEIFTPDGQALPDAALTLAEVRQNPQVAGAAPFIGEQGLLVRGEEMKGASIRGIDPEQETQVTDVAAQLKAEGVLQRLEPGRFHIILGRDLARMLGVVEGDALTLLAPGGQMTPVGVTPRMKQMTVAGVFDSGHHIYDSTLALIHMEDARRIFQLEGPTGVRARLHDMHQAPQVTQQLAATLTGRLLLLDWPRQNSTWYAAVQIEKRMMAIILALIVAVAAFNLVSTLVMTVQDKRADIAILRTLGASPRSVMAIFIVQGAVVGVIGTLAGLLLGLGIAANIDVIVPALEQLLGFHFIPKDVYMISELPSDPQAGDIVPICLFSLLMSFVVTLYPSWRASRVNPAEALRYE